MASNEGVEDDLDDILDSALEDFTKVSGAQGAPATSSSSKAAAAAAASSSAAPAPATLHEAECDVPVSRGSGSASTGGELLEVKGLGMPALGKKKKKKEKAAPKVEVASVGSSTARPSAQRPSETASSSGSGTAGTKKQARTLTDTVERLAAQTRQTVEGIRTPEAVGSRRGGEGDADTDGAAGEEEEMMERLVKQFEEMGTQDIQGLMDTMLQQLLSKDVLHEPMVEIRNRYPDWLTANSSKLSPEDLDRYTRQYECIQRLCQLYESKSDNFTAILAVMKEMQECGQPPADIIQDLAPGLEIGEDGLPVIPDLGAGDLPPNCSVM